jgi:DNA modification methylase
VVPITVPGDLWILGNHRLLCGDATSMEAIETVLDGGTADMVFIDPPYNVAYQGKTADKFKIRNDELGDKFYEFLRQACANLIAVCHGGIYICMSSSELHTLYRAFTEAGGHWSTFVIFIVDEDFQKIKLQLRALGIIAKGTGPDRSAKYWSLTPYGDTLMTQIGAIRSKTGGEREAVDALESSKPVLRQKWVRQHVITLQRVHNDDADRRVVGSR